MRVGVLVFVWLFGLSGLFGWVHGWGTRKLLDQGFPKRANAARMRIDGTDELVRKVEADPAIVAGDVVTDPNKYPWIVSFAWLDESTYVSSCTGSIVDEKLVFIATHCVQGLADFDDWAICHGVDIDNATCHEIEQVIGNADWTNASLNKGNDVALIKTKTSLLENGAKILKISSLPPLHLQPTWSVGYGLTNEGGADLTVLRELDTVAVDSRLCLVVTLDGGQIAHDKLVCADGNFDRTEGVVCQGDSGSPLLVEGSNPDDYYALGTLSFVGTDRVTGKCMFTAEGAYTTSWEDEQLDFILTSAQELDGAITLAESPSCDREAYIQCLTNNRLACVLESPGDDCCSTVETAIDCITPIAAECGNQALIDAIPVAAKSLIAEAGCSRGRSSNPPCFPGSSYVVTETGDEKLMRDLEVGDRVLVKGGSFSDVYAFGHRDEERRQQFVQLECGEHGTLELSGDHYVVSEGRLVLAKAMQVGSIVELGNGAHVQVTGKRVVIGVGVYNPHTLDGTIVVNGVVASTYTRAVDPKVAEILLWIPRVLYRLGVKNPLGSLLHGSTPEWIRRWIPQGSTTISI